MERIIKEITNEIDKAEDYIIHNDCTIYETESNYQAYIDGLNFVLSKIKDTSYVTSPSIWDITFVDNRKIKIKAGDIVSCLNELIEMNESIDEIVTLNCLAD